MPPSVQIALVVLGGVLLLVAILGGRFKIFGAEVTGKASRGCRWASAILGVVLIAFCIISFAMKKDPATPDVPKTGETSTRETSTEETETRQVGPPIKK